jgi:hypothetical protein
MILHILAIVLYFGFSVPASLGQCYVPSAPSCASYSGAFDDEHDFRRRRNDMESYKSDLESYLSCMKRESDSAIMEYSDAVASFNRRARS